LQNQRVGKKPPIPPELQKYNFITRAIIQIGVSKCVFKLGLFVCYIAVGLIVSVYFDLGSFSVMDYNKLMQIEGTFSENGAGRSKGISITDQATNKKYTKSGYIYHYYEKDFGKKAKALVGNDAIYQIEIDGVVKISYSETVKGEAAVADVGKKMSIIGFLIILLAGIIKLWRGSEDSACNCHRRDGN
jgi:hypothetical protein